MAQILYSRGLWGMPEADLETQCKRIADGGFDAVEAFIPFGERAWQESLATAAGAAGLRIVAQFHTRREHLEEALERVDRGIAEVLDLVPLLINCHSGSDMQDLDWNIAIIEGIEQAAGSASVCHEIHRGRCTWNARDGLALIEARPQTRYCADLSHWCCVHEGFLKRQQEAVSAVIERSIQIHARVGHPQGLQVTHWRAPEHEIALNCHLAWWDAIVAARGKADEALVICPEFGPAPYQVSVPFTDQPLSDNWEINHSMMRFLKERYGTSTP